MKAIYMTGYGAPDVITFGELPDASAGKGQVLVKVRFCSLNPLDFKIRSGALSPVSGRTFPRPLGSDFSGTVTAVGAGVTNFSPGQEVYGHANIMFGAPGALAELVAVPAKNLRLRPNHMPADAAACMAVAGTTALNGLAQCGSIEGKRVLITGASGGVGHLAVQLAKVRGAVVSGSASSRNEAFVRKMGADHFFDYKTTVPGKMGPADIFFDAFGSTRLGAAQPAMSGNAYFVTTLPTPGLILRRVFGGRVRFANRKTAPEFYQELEDCFAHKTLHVEIGGSFDLPDGARALEQIEAGGTPGKLVVRVSG